MTNPLNLIKGKKAWGFPGRRSNASQTTPDEQPQGASDLRSTRPSTPLDFMSPRSSQMVPPPSSPSPSSTPNRIVALPQEYGSPTASASAATESTPTRPPRSSISNLKRTLSSKGSNLKRSFSTSTSKTKENLVSIKGLKRSSSGAYERLGPLSESPEEDLGHWLCCQGQDDVSAWPCKKKNDLGVSVCGRCGHWVCDGCEITKYQKEKDLGAPVASLSGAMF